MPSRLFGTDGVRGVAGTQLTAELALGIGRAATKLAAAQRSGQGPWLQPRVLIIRDTRESGQMLQAALAAGVSGVGGEALLGGVLPTPAAPLLLKKYSLDVAVVISASHNPYTDNGIKLFGSDGFKLSDELEKSIEALLDLDLGEAPAPGRVRDLRGADEDYVRALHMRFAELHLLGKRIALDCANGATYAVAPDLFRRLGAEVSEIAVQPDGRNINDGCGSTHLQPLIELMKGGEHHIGFAFDGDGDRVLAVDRSGAVADGDELLALAAVNLESRGLLEGNGVAVTVMTNYGFHAAMEQAGIEVATTQVGDRYVLEELRARRWSLGGEQSGHIIELGFNTSGDGIAAALLTLEALDGRDLSERQAMQRLPQSLINVRVPVGVAHVIDKFVAAPSVLQEAERVERELAGRGRVLLRPSGTEPLVRVMVEAPTQQEAETLCGQIVAAVEAELAQAGA